METRQTDARHHRGLGFRVTPAPMGGLLVAGLGLFNYRRNSPTRAFCNSYALSGSGNHGLSDC
eukprot:912314-Lingulodinium_polyedra.AAC.1